MSLLVSGVLTWFLVRDIEFGNAQDQLAREVVGYRTRILLAECLQRTATPAGGCPTVVIGGVRQPGLTPVDQYQGDLQTISSDLAGNRLLLLDRDRRVVYDSAGPGAGASNIAILPITRAVAGEQVPAGEVQIGRIDYFAAAVALQPARDPLRAAAVVLARPRSAVAGQATASLLPRLFLAAGVSLLAALILALLISRALTRPLTELADAAEDIGRGNYGRRVSIEGDDEVGVTGRAFNRMAEAVERARQTQREFLANVSHELKTPLTSLIGFSQALVDGSLTEEPDRQRAATIIHEESERVLRMAQELLDLARVEGGHIAFNLQPVDVAAMLQQELDLVRRRAEERGLEVELDAPPSLPPATADAERLHQILDNLLDNALKYAPAGSRIKVDASRDSFHVVIAVSNRVGTHRPDPDRMFERFYRADPSRSADAGRGVGLGLAISHELAHAMGGALGAELDAEGWLRMHLTLPASPDASPPFPESRPHRAAPRAAFPEIGPIRGARAPRG